MGMSTDKQWKKIEPLIYQSKKRIKKEAVL